MSKDWYFLLVSDKTVVASFNATVLWVTWTWTSVICK